MEEYKKEIDQKKLEQVFRHFRIGEHLLQRKVVSLNQLVEALEEQQNTGGLIGEILVNKGYISDIELKEILEWQDKIDSMVKNLIQESNIKLSE